jgi:YD repeat-containing protein
MTETTPGGRKRVREQITKEYDDRDSDGISDYAVEEVSTDGKLVRYETDNLYDFKKVLTTPENRQVVSYYDEDTGLTQRVQVGGLHDTVYGYYDDGRLKDITVGTRTTHFDYDMVSDPKTVTVTDPKNRITVYRYDSMMRLKSAARPDSSTVSFDYDRNGNMTVLFPPSEFPHKFGYNGVNLNDSYKTPLENTYSYSYDRDRRLREKRFPSGNKIIYAYDPAKLGHIETPEGNIFFTYDDCGTKVKTVSKGGEILEYGYDGSLLVSETLSGTLEQSLVCVYNNTDGDRDFNIDALTYAGGTESYARDDDGLLTDAGRFHITRNAGNGLPGSITDGTLNLSRSFNGYGENDGETFAVGGQEPFSWHIDERYNDGAVKQKTEDSSAYVYTYDDMGRLLSVTKDGTLSEEYRYDDFGRRDYEMNVPRGIAGRSLTYDEEDRLLTVGNAIYEYDEDGFLKNKTDGPDVTEYAYSSRGELLSVTLPDGTLIEYVHDPLGRRIAKKVNGVVTEKYLWQGLTRLLAVYDRNDNLLI